jgi:dihydrofolate reductase
MGRIVAVTHLTLDGVMQAPGGLDEDTRDDFRYGGWSPPYGDAVMASSFGPGTRSDRSEDGGLLFGRRTYIQLHDAWRDRTANPFTDRLNAAQKYVASNTLAEPLPWENSTLITGDVPRAVTELKRKVLGDLVVIGSGMLLRSLMRHDLVDELLMTIHPLVLGAGHRLFPSDGPRIPLKLTETKPTTTGVIIARYELEDASTTPK